MVVLTKEIQYNGRLHCKANRYKTSSQTRVNCQVNDYDDAQKPMCWGLQHFPEIRVFTYQKKLRVSTKSFSEAEITVLEQSRPKRPASDEQLIEELSKGGITARRYPPERIKSANGRDRIIKIELYGTNYCAPHARRGRQRSDRRSWHSYARRDYTSEELELDRTLRKQAGMSNAKLGMLQYVVRDLRICKLKTPRELPRRYPATSQNAPRTTSGIPLGPIEASLCIVLRISLFSNDCIFILCYRSRSCSAIDFQKFLEELCLNRLPVVILGDFNFFDIRWSRLSQSLSKSRLSRQGSLFINFVESHSFTQTVLEPTHAAPFSTSDHATVTFTLSTIHSQPVSKPILDFAKDYDPYAVTFSL
ncbi:hypothetical protein COOONC_23165 [Cooperia oncophora]